jgi:gamma-glutamyltranspeptidase/glutathione hydrolase
MIVSRALSRASLNESDLGPTSGGVRRQGARPRAVALATLLFAIGCGAATVAAIPTPQAPKPAAKRATLAPEASGARHAVATENGEASKIALEVLRAGGDAVDAAIAGAFALGVATPTACGIGGGGFAVVYRAKTRETFVIDFREVAPIAVDVAALDRRPLRPDERGHVVGVPGEPAGLHALHAKYGKRAFRDDVAPAIALARRGFSLTDHVRKGAAYKEKDLRALAPTLAVRVLGEGGPLPTGTRITRPDLADTLQAIADRGPKAFYEGAVAQAIVDAARSVGSPMTLEDLSRYAPKIRKPVRFTFGEREIFTMPPPSAGGVMLAQALRAHAILAAKDGRGLAADPLGSGAYLHRVAEIMRGALDDRAHSIGDPEANPVDVDALITDARLAARLAKIDPWSTKAPAELKVDEHGTSHLSVVDAEGNAVALTTTVNGPFGARLVAGTTGIMLNDELDDFGRSIDAIGVRPNVPRPGARPTSSMTPTIVIERGLPVAVLGGSGGYRIATSVTAVALAHLVFGQSPGDAVGLPRIHAAGAKLFVEETFAPEIFADLEKRGETLVKAEAMNAVQIVAVSRKGGKVELTAASDPRKGGVALAE